MNHTHDGPNAPAADLPGTAGARNDLTAGNLLAPGERPWRLYIFRPAAGRATRLEHRIYVICKPDGRLVLVTFAVHTPVEGRAVRSGIARVPDLAVSDLDRIIEAIRRQVQAVEYEEVDLSRLETVKER